MLSWGARTPNYTKLYVFLSENTILEWLGFVLEASILKFCVKITDNDVIKGVIMEFE